MNDATESMNIDWCSRAKKLREVEMALLSGEMITEARFGNDMAKYASASLADVRRALQEATEKCKLTLGERPRPTRYAMRGRFRPY
ncbi:hypothetical protein HBA92_21050 [Ochrobactrum sp. MR28]|nr:hypothetical protein [Ochrobactrum sp. MR28]MBX8818774.1 hypothetical protein [Ochrobactrum sp. MR31]